jgi:membrane-associated phospholipid phosphatase
MSVDPWFSDWNHNLLRVLFRCVPHRAFTDDYCDLLIVNPLLSSWVFAACFYRSWTKDDEQQTRRRGYLARSVVAFGIAALVTLILRPWIHWPAPVLNPNFQPLYPRYLWGAGSRNCFPSHSTLAYFMMAVGFWPLNRRLSLWLSGMALFFISLPRVYVGGHYPIDVLFSCVLGVLVLVAVWRCPIPVGVSNWWTAQKLQGAAWGVLFFLWAFELGEGFRGVELLVGVARRAVLR